jgi:2'-5' RNA ligase
VNSATLTRAFFALEIPAEVKDHLRQESSELQDRLPRARWVRPQGLHLTLKFLGEHRFETIRSIAEKVAPALSQCHPVTVSLKGSGFFPSPSRPRVAWVGGEASGASRLARIIDDAAAAVGLAREHREWALHLTLARLKDPWPKNAVDQFLAWGEKTSFDSFSCAEVVLFESRLEPGGAVYTPLERLALA